ncbi:MAG: S26 family signal peptidase [Candidatus Methanoperedens sp.]|nr:S26 family signal peptidase [Candidatus Methanoperedens sp.]
MDLKDKIKYFKESDNFLIGLLRDFLFVFIVVVMFSSISYIALGRFSPMVAVESGSMIPHIQIGDIIFVESVNRTKIITFNEGKETGYSTFDEYGDVILYKPRGRDGITPIIHRAMYFVNAGEPMWTGGPPAPFAGYITKGDNQKTNSMFDQQGSISPYIPVKPEWVIGVARFNRIPWVGCVSLASRGIFTCFN